ncbi:MAG: type IV secretion system DNA-binding domain-containing protein [bacterium]
MNISLDGLATFRFAPDDETEGLNQKLKEILGLPYRYQPARLAIARSLADPTQPQSAGKKSGRVIICDTLFGSAEYRAVWIAAIVEHANDAELDQAKLADLVSAHWRRGIKLLDEEWQKSDQDMTNFLKRLVESAGLSTELPPIPSGSPADASVDDTTSSGQITIPLGDVSKDVSTQEKIEWGLNGAGGSPHCAIMGGVGSGKTRTAVHMLKSIHEQAPSVPLIAFDFKGDLGSGSNAYQINDAFGARTISPPREPIPLDVLSLPSNDEFDIASSALKFRDAFTSLTGRPLGSVQRGAIIEATKQAFRNHVPCELQNVRDALISVYEENDTREDGVTATMREICDFPLFKPELSPASFFQNSWLINLPQSVPADSQKIVVNLILNALDRYLNSLEDANMDENGSRGLRVLCMVDEAHQILSGKLPSLSNLIRMSRSKGGAIMLISQSPDDFSGVDQDFLNEMGLIAAFATNAKSSSVKHVFGGNTNLSSLKKFQCVVKRRSDQTSKKVQSW